jgi:transcription-repair coupling factor (superfamily II helicase)
MNAVRELNRDGQIFFVHNRIEDMHNVASGSNESSPKPAS